MDVHNMTNDHGFTCPAKLSIDPSLYPFGLLLGLEIEVNWRNGLRDFEIPSTPTTTKKTFRMGKKEWEH